MRALRTTGVIVSCFLLAAHFLRGGHSLVALALLAAPLLLLARKVWAVRVLQVVLLLGALEWIRTLVALTASRLAAGAPYLRMALILSAVATVTALSAIGLRKRVG